MTAWIAGLSFLAAKPGLARDDGLGGRCISVRDSGHALVLDRRHTGHALSGPGDDAVLLHFETHSVPGYLKLRFGESSRVLAAVCFGLMTVLMSGINMYSMGAGSESSAWLGYPLQYLGLVAYRRLYVFLGGLLSAIFNEVLQFV